MRKILTIIIFTLMSLSLVVPTSSAAFYDVGKKSTHYEAVNWAVDLGIVKGYGDGSFKPNNILTEAQFMRMFARYINPTVETETNDYNDLDAVYNFLKAHGVVVAGTNNLKLRNKQFTRLDVAKVFTSYQLGKGKGNLTDKEAINWMYVNNITTGKGIYKDKYKDFGGNDLLKRVHAVAFIKRLFNYGVIDVAKYTREVYRAGQYEAPEGYSLATLEKVNLIKDAYANGKTTYFASYLKEGEFALPFYTLLQYDEQIEEWSTPIVELISGYHYKEMQKVRLADEYSIADEQLLLVNWEGSGGFIYIYVLGINEEGEYSWTEEGGYAGGQYKINNKNKTLTLYENGVLMDTLRWYYGEFIEVD